MPLSDIRTRFIESTGRKDFETNTAAALRFINDGLRWLNLQINTSKSTMRFHKDVIAGDFIFYLQFCRAIEGLCVMDGDGRTPMERRSLHWIRKHYAETYSSLDRGTPLYWAPAVIGLSPEHTAGANLIGDGTFDDVASWAPVNGWNITDGEAVHTPVIAMPLWQDTGVNNTSSKNYYVTFRITKYTAGDIMPYIQSTAGTARNAVGTFSEVITHDGAVANDLILLLWPSADFDGSIDFISMYSVDDFVSTYDWQDLMLGDHHSHRGIIFMPPADALHTIVTFGQFHNKPFSAETDENYWSEEYPALLTLAACFQYEQFMRNTEGAKDYKAGADNWVHGIAADRVQEQLVEVENKMRGYLP